MLFKMFTLRIYIGFWATKLKVVQHERIIMTLLVQCNKTIQMMQLICIFCRWCFGEITSCQFARWELKHSPQSPICVLQVMRASSSASEFYNVSWRVFEMSVRACLRPGCKYFRPKMQADVADAAQRSRIMSTLGHHKGRGVGGSCCVQF